MRAMTIPVLPSLLLGFLSFSCSAYLLFTILFPLLKPNQPGPYDSAYPFRTTQVATFYFALSDLISLLPFWIQTFAKPSSASVSSAQFWLALTSRPTTVLIALSITFLTIRLGRPTSFGRLHFWLWLPALSVVATGTVVAGVLSQAGYDSFWGGVAAYLSITLLVSSVFLCAIASTTHYILRNLQKEQLATEIDTWFDRALEGKRRQKSISTEELRIIKDGESWLTSLSGSLRRSISAWSFSEPTPASRHAYSISLHPNSQFHSEDHGDTGGNDIRRLRESLRFRKHISRHSFPISVTSTGTTTSQSVPFIECYPPPVPPLPSPYKRQGYHSTPPEYTFSHDQPPSVHKNEEYEPSIIRTLSYESANSWLTSTDGTKKTMSSFSFPTTRPDSLATSRHINFHAHSATRSRSRSTDQIRKHALVHGVASCDVEKGPPYPGITVASPGFGLETPNLSSEIDRVFVRNASLWMLIIWIPFALVILSISLFRASSMSAVGILLTLGICLPSPLTVALFSRKIHFPIPERLFHRFSSVPVKLSGHSVKTQQRKSTSTQPPQYSSHPLPHLSLYQASTGNFIRHSMRHSTEFPNTHHKISHLRIRHKSRNYTAVEGRRSGDIWIDNGQAVDGLNRAERVLSLLLPHPRLSVLSPRKSDSLLSHTLDEARERPKSLQTLPTTTASGMSSRLTDEDIDEIAFAPKRGEIAIMLSTIGGDEGDNWSTEANEPSVRRMSPGVRRIGPPLSPPPTIPLPPIPSSWTSDAGDTTSLRNFNESDSTRAPYDSQREESFIASITSASTDQHIIPLENSRDIEPFTPRPEKVLPRARSSEWHRPRRATEVYSLERNFEDEFKGNNKQGDEIRSEDIRPTANPGKDDIPNFTKLEDGSAPKGKGHLPFVNARIAQATTSKGFSKNCKHAPMSSVDTISRKMDDVLRSMSPRSAIPSTPSTAASKRSRRPAVRPLAVRKVKIMARHDNSIAKQHSPIRTRTHGWVPKAPMTKGLNVCAPKVKGGAKIRQVDSLTKSGLVSLPTPGPSPTSAVTAASVETVPTMSIEQASPKDPVSLLCMEKFNESLDLEGKKVEAVGIGDVNALPDRPNDGMSHTVSNLRAYKAANIHHNANGPRQKNRIPCAEKENLPPLQIRPTYLTRSESARKRDQLIQNQILPNVIVRPPSGTSFGEFSASIWMPDEAL